MISRNLLRGFTRRIHSASFRFIPAMVVIATLFIAQSPAYAATIPSNNQPTSVGELLKEWSMSGRTSGSGTWTDEDGQRLWVAMNRASSRISGTVQQTVLAASPSPRTCQGIFDNDKVSVTTLQQSPVSGIPWIIRLAPPNATFGTVTMTAQIFADNNRANVYAPHVEPWNYEFHGPLPRNFQRIGGGTYTMHAGSQVSFLWTWASSAQPTRGGYSYVNCTYSA